MQVIEDQGSDSFEKAVAKNINTNAVLFIDGFKSYSKFKKYVIRMWLRKYRLKRPKFIALGSHNHYKPEKRVNATHQSNKNGYLQNYLNEFCYKINRRYFERQLSDWLMTESFERP